MTNPPLWKASIASAKAEAADIAAALELEGSAQAVLIAEEPFADGAVVEALYTEPPDAAFLSRVAGQAVTVTRGTVPSNNALLTDTSTSPLRAQRGAAKRER